MLYIETHSLVEGDTITELRKLKIEGTDEELKDFAFRLMDAVEQGKIKFMLDETKVIIKRVNAAA